MGSGEVGARAGTAALTTDRTLGGSADLSRFPFDPCLVCTATLPRSGRPRIH